MLNLLALVLETGAWPGVNHEAGSPEMVSIVVAKGASPYQVLRVANWLAGMLNLGIKFPDYKALPSLTSPA